MAPQAAAESHKYVTEQGVSERLQAIEETHDLLRYEFDGWCAWPLLRFSVGRRLQHLPLDAGADYLGRSAILRLAARDLLRMAALPRADVVVKTYASYHVEVEDERRVDIYFDGILRRAERGFKIEVINGKRFLRDPIAHAVPRDMSTTGLGLVGDRLSRRRPPPGMEAVANEISAVLQRELGDGRLTPGWAQQFLSSFYWMKRLYGSILRRLTPEVVLLADIGDFPITAAARELGIPVVEFQHGITHRWFPGNSWSRYAVPFKKKMAVPDRVFLYGDYWIHEMSAHGFWGPELRAVGSARIDQYRRLKRPRSGEEYRIVVTTQGTDTERLVAFMQEFCEQAHGRIPYRLVFKMHPAYFTSRPIFDAAFAGNERVSIVNGSDQPGTFELLVDADLHVSIYSFCHYEALALGVPTAVLPLTGAENVAHLVDAGHALNPGTPAELVGAILNMRHREDVPTVGLEYFAANAVDNIAAELRDIRS